MIKDVLYNGKWYLHPLFSKIGTKKVGGQEIRGGFSGETAQRKRKGIWKPPSGGPPREMIHLVLPVPSKGPPKHVKLQTSSLAHHSDADSQGSSGIRSKSPTPKAKAKTKNTQTH